MLGERFHHVSNIMGDSGFVHLQGDGIRGSEIREDFAVHHHVGGGAAAMVVSMPGSYDYDGEVLSNVWWDIPGMGTDNGFEKDSEVTDSEWRWKNDLGCWVPDWLFRA